METLKAFSIVLPTSSQIHSWSPPLPQKIPLEKTIPFTISILFSAVSVLISPFATNETSGLSASIPFEMDLLLIAFTTAIQQFLSGRKINLPD